MQNTFVFTVWFLIEAESASHPRRFYSILDPAVVRVNHKFYFIFSPLTTLEPSLLEQNDQNGEVTGIDSEKHDR